MPCKNCLVLGACKHKVVLECSLLYEFFHMKLKSVAGPDYEAITEILSIRHNYLPYKGLRKIINGENKREIIWF